VWPRGEIRGHILDDLAGGDIIGMKVFQRFHGAEVITMDFFYDNMSPWIELLLSAQSMPQNIPEFCCFGEDHGYQDVEPGPNLPCT
jgi:hypothetical protein